MLIEGNALDGLTSARFAGGGGVPPRCSNWNVAQDVVSCTLQCDQTSHGEWLGVCFSCIFQLKRHPSWWAVSVKALGSPWAVVPGTVRCHVTPTVEPSVTILTGCGDELGLAVPTCSAGDTVRLQGSGFDTLPWRNDVLLYPEGDIAGFSDTSLRPACGVDITNSTFTTLICTMSFVPRGLSGTLWRFIVRTRAVQAVRPGRCLVSGWTR